MSACWFISRALALIPPVTGPGSRIIVGDAVCICGEHLFSIVGPSSGRANVGGTCQIAGTAPGILLLFRVC